MPVQTFTPMSLRVDLQPRLETQCLSAEHPCTLLPPIIPASQTARVSASPPLAVDHRRSGAGLQQGLGRTRARRLAMFVLASLRMAASVWTEARAMQAEMMRRYPHLRD
jgi:hypothetical protein